MYLHLHKLWSLIFSPLVGSTFKNIINFGSFTTRIWLSWNWKEVLLTNILFKFLLVFHLKILVDLWTLTKICTNFWFEHNQMYIHLTSIYWIILASPPHTLIILASIFYNSSGSSFIKASNQRAVIWRRQPWRRACEPRADSQIGPNNRCFSLPGEYFLPTKIARNTKRIELPKDLSRSEERAPRWDWGSEDEQ